MQEFVERTPDYIDGPLNLVIGCGDLGLGCARVLGRRAPLLLVDIDGERLDRSVAMLRHDGFIANGHRCDIADSAQVEALGAALAKTKGVRVLAHVAAVGNTPGGWRAVMKVDLIGAHLVARAAAPHMTRGGVAILISSTGSYQCPVDDRIHALIDAPLEPDFLERFAATLGYEPDFLEAYFIAKQGVNRLAQRLALDWGSQDVRAVSLSPGLINSTMGRTGGSALPVYDGSENKVPGSRSEKAIKEVPLGRQGTLLEITSVVEFLASDAASFINGIDIPVDGGSTALWRVRGVIAR
jgi:NAD(P)-dependent dehydrogenase (short-subunit alcohol dehydrogenase family)